MDRSSGDFAVSKLSHIETDPGTEATAGFQLLSRDWIRITSGNKEFDVVNSVTIITCLVAPYNTAYMHHVRAASNG